MNRTYLGVMPNMKSVTQRCLLLAVAGTIAACGSDSVKVSNKGPTGTVGGYLLDGATDAALADVDVQILSAGKVVATTKTGADGLFSASGVATGTFLVNFTKSGYVPVVAYQGFLDGAVGNFPIDNPTETLPALGMVPSSGTFTVKVLDDSAKPLAGVSVTARPQIRYIEYSNGPRYARGNYTVLGMSDMNGTVELSGLPDYSKLGTFNSQDGATSEVYGKVDRLWLDVAPVKDAQSGVYLFSGLTTYFDVTRVGQQVPTISLAGPNTALQVLDSNIEYLINMTSTSSRTFTAQLGSVLPQTSPYYVLFNQAIDNDVRVQITDEAGAIQPITLSATIAGNLLIVTPMVTPMGPLPGKRYNLVLSVTALSNSGTNGSGKELAVTAPFWIQSMQPNVTVQTGIGALVMSRSGNDILMNFQLSEPVGVGGGFTSALPCVVYYENADLDGDDNVMTRGEYGSGANLSCVPPDGNALDISQIRPVLSADTNSPRTGYYSTWQVTLDRQGTDGPCKAGFTGCVRPQAGRKAYLVFSKTESTSTVRRPDGKPVSNVVEITIPSFPPAP